MTLEKHIMDTMKEWQTKIGSLDTDIRLYYPKASLCRYLNLDVGMDNDELRRYTETYLSDSVKYLGHVAVSADGDRFCILVGREGCNYVEQQVASPEFLTRFLEVLETQDMHSVMRFFESYAAEHGTTVCMEQEEDGGRVLYLADERVEPYMYCIDQNEFGITYHRFTKGDYSDL